MKLGRVRGTRDLVAGAAQAIARVATVGTHLLETAGYRPVYLPTLEAEELFRHSLGAGSDIVMKEMFQVADPSGHRIVLRPEGTVGCMRAYLQSCPSDAVKWQYTGSMFRRERPQQGRYREFVQLGAEVIGFPALPFVDIELISLAAELLKSLQITAELRLNTLGIESERRAYCQRLKSYFESHSERLSPTSRERLQRNPMRILDSKEQQDRDLLPSAPRLAEDLSTESMAFYEEVKAGLTALRIQYIEDPWLVRGLDYYCHTCFEFIVDGRAVVAGGRYNTLSSQLGAAKDYPGSGWAAGVDRLAELLPTQVYAPVGVVAVGKEQDAQCRELVSRLRSALGASRPVLFLPGSLSVSQSMKLLHKLSAQKVILIGEDEARASQCKVKDMATGAQTAVAIESVEKAIKD